MFGCGGDSGLYHLSDELIESIARVDRREALTSSSGIASAKSSKREG